MASVGESSRLVTVVLEVADLGRSVRLYRDGFGLDLHVTDHRGADHGADDRWRSMTSRPLIVQLSLLGRTSCTSLGLSPGVPAPGTGISMETSSS